MKLNTLIKTTALSAVVAASFGAALNVQAADETFQATIKLLQPITITEVASLRFPEQIAGSAATVLVRPEDSGAAVFDATGEADRAVTASVLEASIEMITDDGIGAQKRITVDQFAMGGSVDPLGGGAFDAAGTLNNIRVGGTANVNADNIPGDYVGTATFRLVYA